MNKNEQDFIPIKGMAKGYEAYINYYEHEKVFMVIRVPKPIRKEGFVAIGWTLWVITPDSQFTEEEVNDYVMNSILSGLKEFIQEAGNHNVIRKIPSEDDLLHVTSNLLKQFKQRREIIFHKELNIVSN